jgi:hypothetical protein
MRRNDKGSWRLGKLLFTCANSVATFTKAPMRANTLPGAFQVEASLVAEWSGLAGHAHR